MIPPEEEKPLSPEVNNPNLPNIESALTPQEELAIAGIVQAVKQEAAVTIEFLELESRYAEKAHQLALEITHCLMPIYGLEELKPLFRALIPAERYNQEQSSPETEEQLADVIEEVIVVQMVKDMLNLTLGEFIEEHPGARLYPENIPFDQIVGMDFSFSPDKTLPIVFREAVTINPVGELKPSQGVIVSTKQLIEHANHRLRELQAIPNEFNEDAQRLFKVKRDFRDQRVLAVKEQVDRMVTALKDGLRRESLSIYFAYLGIDIHGPEFKT